MFYLVSPLFTRRLFSCIGNADGGVVSGARATSDLLLYINVALAMKDGVQFYRSANGVILTRGLLESGTLPLKYFKSAENRSRDGKMILLDVRHPHED